jgi:pSer/pThr/pTyr-binding forkhead associated (FHA) protein
VLVKDLGSSNGTYVNSQQVMGAAELGPGDDLLVGVTVLELHAEVSATERQSGVRVVPDALRVPERTPDYVPTAAEPAQEEGFPTADPTAELKPYLDVKVKKRTRLAPFVVIGLAGLFVLAYELTNGLGSLPDLKIIW